MKKLTILFILIAVIFLSTHTYAAEVTRINGQDRYLTSVEVSKATFKNAGVAIVASGENFPDALIGGTLAVQLESPVLLSSKGSIKQEVLDELNRLDTKMVILLGGQAAVSNKVAAQITNNGQKVMRVAGDNRYETCDKIIELRYELRPDQTQNAMGDGIYYVTGTNFPDALSASPLFGQSPPHLDGIMSYLALLKPGQDPYSFTVIGGPKAIYHGYDTEKPDYTGYDYRIAGKNRYSTAVEIAKKYPEYLGKKIDTVVLVSGTNFPDALSSAPLTGSLNACTLLTTTDKLPQETREYLKNNNIKKVIFVGGENAITNDVYAEIKNIY